MRLIVVWSAASFAISAHAASIDCKALHESWGRPIQCYCGAAAVKNLKVTLPAGLRIVAACGEAEGPARLDLTKELSLDTYDENGGFPQGDFYLSGDIVLKGTVSIDPGNAGDLWFSVSSANISKAESVFTRYLEGIKLDWERDYKKFNAPPYTPTWTGCWHANATIRISGLVVNTGETDGQGAYPLDFSVLKVSGNKCVK